MIAIGCPWPFVLMSSVNAFNSAGDGRGKTKAAAWIGRTSRQEDLREGGSVCIGMAAFLALGLATRETESEAPAGLNGRGFCIQRLRDLRPAGASWGSMPTMRSSVAMGT